MKRDQPDRVDGRRPKQARPLARRIDDWFERRYLRKSKYMHVDGLWVGDWDAGHAPRTLPRVEEALRLIKEYDPLRYRYLLRDLDRVWVKLLTGAVGQFDYSLKACEIDERYVLATTTSSEMIASTIVHEATHARLIRCRIGYEEKIRARVERICFRRQISFCKKLPNGEPAREQVERKLAYYTAPRWTNAAMVAAYEKGTVEALRYLGCPEWVIRAIFRYRALIWSARRAARRIRRLFGTTPPATS
ncbi:MAG TPA: hypothetical protein VGR79_08245 [Stellaceae bacterium]|nr:hypothetical protein [Stellaceae bacterium]